MRRGGLTVRLKGAGARHTGYLEELLVLGDFVLHRSPGGAAKGPPRHLLERLGTTGRHTVRSGHIDNVDRGEGWSKAHGGRLVLGSILGKTHDRTPGWACTLARVAVPSGAPDLWQCCHLVALHGQRVSTAQYWTDFGAF